MTKTKRQNALKWKQNEKEDKDRQLDIVLPEWTFLHDEARMSIFYISVRPESNTFAPANHYKAVMNKQ